jgi:hypothetical protein
MMVSFCKKYVGVFALSFLNAIQLHAENVKPDPVATTTALRPLLAISNAEIPKNSSCQGDYGQIGKAKVKDLLAIQLAYLYSGENVIQGKCADQTCVISITHASDENVSSATVKFNVAQGRAKIATLQCVTTP